MPPRGKKKAKRSAGGRKRSAGKRAAARKGGARKRGARKTGARKGARKVARKAARKTTARKRTAARRTAPRPQSRGPAAVSSGTSAGAMGLPQRSEPPKGGAIELERDEMAGGMSEDMFAGAEDHDVTLPDEDLD